MHTANTCTLLERVGPPLAVVSLVRECATVHQSALHELAILNNDEFFSFLSSSSSVISKTEKGTESTALV